MRKLWPPTFDRFTTRFWACLCSVILNILFALALFVAPDVGWWFFLPGLLPILMLTGGWFVSLAFLGNVFVLIVNLGFYYFLTWWIIAACRRPTNWWPAKSS
jgi:hypothetical protein